MEGGDLHPSIERALLEIAWGRPGDIDKCILAAVAGVGAGLINVVLRRPLTDDPLADAKQVVTVRERSPQERALPPLTAPQVASIIPPSRPAKKPTASGPPLKPGEEVME